MNEKTLLDQIRGVCQLQSELVPMSTLCDSVASIGLREPLLLGLDASVKGAVDLLRSNKVGCVLITDDAGKILGIFTERDCVVRVTGVLDHLDEVPISQVMTLEPMAERPDATIAFALTLMSHGGFRHLPIVDQDGVAIGVISVKDVIDYLVSKITDAVTVCKMGGV